MTFSNRAAWDYVALHGFLPEEAVGLVAVSTARSTGTLVGVYDAVAAGIEDDDEHALGWATVCEPHGTLCLHATKTLARSFASVPEDWCEDCRNRKETTHA